MKNGENICSIRDRIMASKVLKVFLIGCGLVVVAGIVVVGVGGYLLKQWGTEKYKELTQGEGEISQKTEQLSRDYPFTEPANGVITEAQLKRFIAVRTEMYAVYQRYEGEIKKLAEQKEGLSTVMKGWGLWKDVRTAQANALVRQKMPPEEYQYIVTGVYKTWAAAGTREALNDQTFADVANKQLKESIASLDQQIENPNTPEAAKPALKKTREELQQQLDNLPKNSTVNQMDETLQSVPKENIELFKKYQAEIQKYSMSGLEYIGL